MHQNAETRLRDGTRISDLINHETREVKVRVLSDPELYELEMERIFAKTWIFLGHETEIPNKGDFITRDMGSDAVIVARDRDNEIHVSLNVCPHRAMKVQTHDAGNTNVHMCIYHGWSFGVMLPCMHSFSTGAPMKSPFGLNAQPW